MSNEVANYLGRCRDCDYALFATSESIEEADNAVAGGPAVNVGNGQIMGRCTNGHRWFALSRVKGTYSDKHTCDSRCLNAKGHECTCSCGGANHGRGYAVTPVVDHAPAAPASKHLGEVGKHIRGTATVAQEADDRRPYQFRTDSGSIIVWWLPNFIENPGYKLGQSVTFRAKVKAHGEFNGVAQTTVTYFEEVE
jgi:hypothetical protein